MATNVEATSANAILMKSQDQYLLTPCAAKKFIEVELCQEILFDSLMIANFEYFSSMFKQFRVFISNHSPPKSDDWQLVGTFLAANIRKEQKFLIPPPHSWSKYISSLILDIYGYNLIRTMALNFSALYPD